MGLKVRRATMILALAALAGGLAEGCEGSEGSHLGSGAHFLESCDTSCASGLACLSGVCTTTCGKDADCTGIAAAATCIDSGASSAPGTCDVLCKSDADCASLDVAGHCASGRCRATSAGADASVGTGGRGAGTGGAAGAGGRPPGTGGTDARGGAGGKASGGAASGSGGAVGTGGTRSSGGTAGTGGGQGSGGVVGTGGATDAGAVADAGHIPESAVSCTYTLTVDEMCTSDSRCVGLPAPVSVSATHVPVHEGSCGVPSTGALPGESTIGVEIDAPSIFGAWTLPVPLPNSFCVVPGAGPFSSFDWRGAPFYGLPRSTTQGVITVTNGQASINLSVTQVAAGGTFGCPPLTTSIAFGCVNQTITCNGGAFVPGFAR